MSASRSWRWRPRRRDRRRGCDRSDQDRSRSNCRMWSTRWKACSRRPQRAVERQCRGRPDQPADGQVGGRAISPRGRQQNADGPPAEEWSYGDIDAGFKAAKVVDRGKLRSRRLFAPLHGTAHRLRLLAGWQVFPLWLQPEPHRGDPNIARYIGIEPKELVFIAEYCGGGFGSKIPGYPNMAIAGADVEEDRPAGDACASPASRNMRIGSARPDIPGSRQDRLPRRRQAARRRPLHRAGKRAGIGGGDFRSAGNALSLVYQPTAMRFRAVPVLTNTPLRRTPARSGREPARRRDRADDRQGGA